MSLTTHEVLTYDRNGRMNPHPEYHPNHGKPFSLADMAYIAKFYESDGSRSIGFALGRAERAVAQKVSAMRKSGEWDWYKNLSNDAWLELIEQDPDWRIQHET